MVRDLCLVSLIMFGKKKEDKLSLYQDPTGEFSNRSLKLGEWYLSHKVLLQKIGMTILIVWCVITMGIGISYFGYYLVFGYTNDSQMYAQQTLEFQNYENLQVAYKPQDLQVRRVQVFESATDKYDMSAQVVNPNERWVAYVDYKYKYGGGETDIRTEMLLPGEARPIVYFGVESPNYPSKAELVFGHISWKKINAHYVKDVKAFIDQRKIFEMSNFDFTKASRSTGASTNIIEFDITNASSYGYWDLEFIVELIDGPTVGYLYILEDQFRAGDTRHIDVRSTVDNLNVSDIKVHPVVDVFDLEKFMAPGK